MSHKPGPWIVVVVALAHAACVTPGAPTPTASTPAATAPAPTPDPEVQVLRDRVARLEKRLVEVDTRLGLLLARGDVAEPARPLRFDRPRGEQRAVDLTSSPEPVAEGLASIDIGTRGGGLGDTVTEEGPAIIDNSDGGSVTIKMSGDGGVVSDADDPLAALTTAPDLYAWGQARFKEGRTTEAIAAFEDVVSRFPGHDLADNALYWTGRCHQQKGDHRLAIDVWQKLPARFPRSPKVSDALFGMAQSHEALGEPAVAEALYDEVVSSYPKAEKLKDAKKALSRLRP